MTLCHVRMEADKLEELRQKVVDIREQHRHRAGHFRNFTRDLKASIRLPPALCELLRSCETGRSGSM